MSQETVFYQDDQVRVTNSRAVLKGKTYAMANITSVSHVDASASLVWPVIIFLIGLVVFLFALMGDGTTCTLVVGIAMCVGVVGWFVFLRTRYAVVIGSASGETQALVSRDKSYTAKVAAAINEAIVRRG